MHVLHISESDAAGGAARTAHRLHRGLPTLGHDSRMLVGRKVTGDPAVRSIKRHLGWRGGDRLALELLEAAGLQYTFYPSSFGVLSDPWYRSADVIQLHNLHGSYFSFTALPRLSRAKPVVWLLQDQWPLTGHVAYSHDCERWQSGCGSCPYLGEYPAVPRDTTALLWRLKREVYARSRLTLVVPSHWMLELVRASPLLSRFPVELIHHGVDTETFRPFPRDEARRRLGLSDERLVLFTAHDLTERRKGLHLLEEALTRMADPPLLVLAGHGEPELKVRAHSLGAIEDDDLLAQAYSAVDVLAAPTVADALTQNTGESLACGTPCVTFDRGGVSDVVEHGQSGYQARFGDVDDLARGIAALLDAHDGIGGRCRERALRHFALADQLQRYTALYEQVLTGAAADARTA